MLYLQLGNGVSLWKPVSSKPSLAYTMSRRDFLAAAGSAMITGALRVHYANENEI